MKTLLTLALFSVFSIAASASEIPVLSCVGTEPFWGISTDAKGFLSYGDPSMDGKKFYSKSTMKNAAGTSGDFAFQIEARDMSKNGLKLNVVKTECNDGMSDAVYTYTALVEVNGGLLFGCCN